MRVLLDSCVSGGAREALINAGHDVIWAGEWPSDPGDDEILRRAHAESRVLITIDKDFGELAVLQRRPHSGIVRLVALRARQQGPTIVAVLDACWADLERGAIVTAERGRIRIRASQTEE